MRFKTKSESGPDTFVGTGRPAGADRRASPTARPSHPALGSGIVTRSRVRSGPVYLHNLDLDRGQEAQQMRFRTKSESGPDVSAPLGRDSSPARMTA
jgi:hypothetical protein